MKQYFSCDAHLRYSVLVGPTRREYRRGRAALVYGQAVKESLLGTVTDTSAAMVPAAKLRG